MRGIGRFRFPVRSTVRNAQGMRKNPTPAEEKLWGALRAKKIDGFYFRRQRPVGAYIVDFYCDDLKLAIEVDGGIHQDPGVHEFDEEREFYLQQRGVTTIRYTNEQVLHHFDQTLDSIRKQCRDASLPRLTTSERSERGVSGEGSRVGAMTTVAGGVRGGGKDGDGQTVGAGDRARSAMLTLRLSPQLLAQIIPHGSIAIDGVSLTVADVSDDRITVALIPHTLEHTTLGLLQAGDTVNIETDMLLRLHAKGKGHA